MGNSLLLTKSYRLQVYPMWLCPFKLFNEPGLLKVRSGDWQMYVDIGVYGVPKAKGFETVSFIAP